MYHFFLRKNNHQRQIRVKKISLLGSTGSIGRNALAIIDHHPSDFSVEVLAAQQNIDLLEKQARRFRPKLIVLQHEAKARELQQRLPHIPVLGGSEGLLAAATYDTADLVIGAIAGTAGIAPAFAALQAGKTLALANKEALVSAGELLTRLAKEKNLPILPIDSEHSAIFQCLQGQAAISSVRRLILTASGGPFRNYSLEQLQNITVNQALNHPNWHMGPKVTIDCSTLMNKGLEAIEAHWLFTMPLEQIEVIIHPQSIIHSMVEFCDGSILSQMGEPDMRVPIQYAMTYPQRKPGMLQPFDFIKNQTLQFFCPDKKKFRCLQLAFDAMQHGGSLPCFMNAANEVLVQRFIDKQIGWTDIAYKLEHLMETHERINLNSLDEILSMDREARMQAACV